MAANRFGSRIEHAHARNKQHDFVFIFAFGRFAAKFSDDDDDTLSQFFFSLYIFAYLLLGTISPKRQK